MWRSINNPPLLPSLLFFITHTFFSSLKTALIIANVLASLSSLSLSKQKTSDQVLHVRGKDERSQKSLLHDSQKGTEYNRMSSSQQHHPQNLR
jgi:hypothetical protein